MAQQNIPNGVPPQMRPPAMEKQPLQFNGVHSSHSSRDSSPSTKYGQIPASQLPPLRSATSNFTPNIPQKIGQLNISPIPNFTQKMEQLNISGSGQFGTSTPNQTVIPQRPSGLVSSAYSPIVSTITPSNLGPQQNPTPPSLQHQQQPQQMTRVNPAFNNQQQPHLQQQHHSYNNRQFTQPQQYLNQFQSPNVPQNLNQNQPPFQKNNPVPLGSYAHPPLPQQQQQQQQQQQFQQNYPPPVNQPPGLQTQQAQLKNNLHVNRYPQMPSSQSSAPNLNPAQQPPAFRQTQSNAGMLQPPAFYDSKNSVTQQGFNRLWGQDTFDLLQNPNVLPQDRVEAPRIFLGQNDMDTANCNPNVFRCTMTKIPETSALLQKSRLPLGVLIHPFRDLVYLPVIQCAVIVRCRACRTYINPFVFFVDSKRWKCNLCYRINELPEEFHFDPVSKTYGDPTRRPEIRSSTIEYIAPTEYMLRPPQPAVYLFLFDVSRLAVESGYLQTVCTSLLDELPNLPGDARTQVGIITYDSYLHFFLLGETSSQPHEMTVLDIDDVFMPCPDNLLVNLKDRMELLVDLLTQLPNMYSNSYDINSALGAALQIAQKMMGPTGGRVTVFQASLPNVGPGALIAREDPSQRASSEVTHLNPANDFYKRLALECSGHQIAVDLFLLNSQYVDIATLSGISRFSGGCIYHFPLFKNTKVLQNDRLDKCFRRYLTRKIGFEAVMRVRCTRGLSIHTFHGNFFVRSTDLLSLPNINPDAAFGMQVAIDENLSDVQTICFQAALLYTSSKGERRIRVHTLCLPVCATLSDVINSADQQCIVGLLAKMAVDRSMQSSLSDAREAFINVAIDILSSYKLCMNMGSGLSGLNVPQCLRLLPLYISALLKHHSFRTGTSTRLDDRVKGMIDMKTKPLDQLIQMIYPDLYPVHALDEYPVTLNLEEEPVPNPPRIQLTARCLESKGAFLMDMGEHMILLVCPGVSSLFLNQALGLTDYTAIPDDMYEIPILENLHNQRLHQFLNYLNEAKPFAATIHIIRDNSPHRVEFYERLLEDRVENALSYHEFLQHLKTQVK